MSSWSHVALVAPLLVGCVVQSNAASFLSQEKFKAIEVVDVEEAMAQFTGSVDSLARIEQQMSVMYAALPKNEHGNLDPATSSYALHRYFVQQYGWNMEGLDPAQLSNTSQHSTIMRDRAPALIQSMLDRQVEGKGMGLREVAIFAGVLTDLIMREVASSFHNTWVAHGLPLTTRVNAERAEEVVKLHMMFFIVEEEMQGPVRNIAQVEVQFREIFPDWDDSYMWVQDFRAIQKWNKDRKNPFRKDMHNFDTEVAFAQDAIFHFSSFQRLGCAALKNDLSEMEHQGSGRVLLSRFYRGALKGDWTFGESENYLRHLGVLDDSDPAAPSVVIPNYINSKTNCLVSTGFYSLCCADECEGLMQHVEAKIGVPYAGPAEIADIVSHLSSDTVDAPRNLSASLLQRLDEVASVNGGVVPLHGRLFAQWMHHAYPRECMQPLVERRATSTLSGKEWLSMNGLAALEASSEELQFHVDKFEEQETKDAFIPWVAKEELIAPVGVSSKSWPLVSLRTAAAVMVMVSSVVAIIRLAPSRSEGKVDSLLV